jgi:hypothetical protein
MASADSLAGLMKWLRRAEWQDAFNELLHRHVGPVCAKFDVAVDELPELIGDQNLTVWGCVFEDFLDAVLMVAQHGRRIPKAKRLERERFE